MKDADTVFLYQWLKDWLKAILCLLLISCGIYLYSAGYGKGLYVHHGIEYVPESTWETYQHRSYLYDGPYRICEVGQRVLFSPSGRFVIFNGNEGVELFSRKSGRVPLAVGMILQSCTWDEPSNRAFISIYEPIHGGVPGVTKVSAQKRMIKLP